MVHKFVFSNMPIKEASDASCNAKTAILWNHRSILCSCPTLQTKYWKGTLRMRRSVDFWYCWISWCYVVGNVRYTVTIDVSYTLGIAHIEVTTWAPTYRNCSWIISMQLFDAPCWWHCRPCSLCSQLLYRSFTTSWLPCCLLHSSHNEGTWIWGGCCCTQILHYVNQVTNVRVNPIVTSFDQIVGNVLGIQISLLLRVYLSTNISWYHGVDQTKQQSNTRFSL
jgi:hypothetical protein